MVRKTQGLTLLLASFSFCGWNLHSASKGSLQGARTKQVPVEQQAQDVREKIRVRSDLVVLSVTVRDGKGNLVSGLGQEEFHVFVRCSKPLICICKAK